MGYFLRHQVGREKGDIWGSWKGGVVDEYGQVRMFIHKKFSKIMLINFKIQKKKRDQIVKKDSQ